MVQNSGSFQVSVNARQSMLVFSGDEMFDLLSADSLSSRSISEISQFSLIFAAALLNSSAFEPDRFPFLQTCRYLNHFVFLMF